MASRSRDKRGQGRPALLVEDLAIGYPRQGLALAGLSFRVANGEQVAVIGPNGAGKSTLFKAIAGLLPFSKGHISIHGLDCHSSHTVVGYVPQQSDIDWSFPASVYDVVMMGRCRHIGWFRLPRKNDRAIVQALLELLSLQDLARRQIGELSGGQQRRVFIARALAQEARVLLMDEPFSGVDQQSEQEVLDALGLLGQQGITVLLSTHHLKNAALHFDKVLLLKGGLLAAYGAPDTVLTGPNLRAAFGAAWPAWPAATNRLFLNGSALEEQREN